MKIMNIWRVIKANKERLTAWSLLSRVIGLILMLSLAPAGALQVSASEIVAPQPQEYKTQLQLDVKKIIPVTVVEKQPPQIVVGESNSDRAIREAKEAEEASKRVKKAPRAVVARDNRPVPVDPSLAEKRALAQKAASAYGIDWKILEAVWQVESGKAWNTATRSYAGAQGPMQFMSGTWRKYAVDGNGDGTADINNAEDAVYAAANLLAQAGASEGNVDAALLSYNHAQWYVNKVKAVAGSIEE